MRLLRGIYRFSYDFVIGDDWKVAAGVVTAVAIGLILLAAGVPRPAVLALTATLVAFAFTLALIIDVRSHRG